jgi:hypothetical protein
MSRYGLVITNDSEPRLLDEAIVASVRPGAGPGETQRLLLALAEVEATAADSKEHAGLWHPVPALDAERWLPLLFDDSSEFDLAASRGSDFHSPEESRIDLGTLPHLPGQLTTVWSLLTDRIQ